MKNLITEYRGLKSDNINLKLSNGAIINNFVVELNNMKLVGYGTPNKKHNCDEMGCPTIAHVLMVEDLDYEEI